MNATGTLNIPFTNLEIIFFLVNNARPVQYDSWLTQFSKKKKAWVIVSHKCKQQCLKFPSKCGRVIIEFAVLAYLHVRARLIDCLKRLL